MIKELIRTTTFVLDVSRDVKLVKVLVPVQSAGTKMQMSLLNVQRVILDTTWKLLLDQILVSAINELEIVYNVAMIRHAHLAHLV